jgi:hypothetical protein
MLTSEIFAADSKVPVKAIRVASDAVSVLNRDLISGDLENVRTNPDILVYTLSESLNISEEKDGSTDQTVALNVDESLRTVIDVQNDPSLAGMITSVVEAAPAYDRNQDRFNGAFLYGTFDVDDEERKHFFGKILQVNPDSIFWSPYFTVSSVDEGEGARLFELEDEGSFGLWTESPDSERTVVVLAQPDGGKTTYDPMLDNESIARSLGMRGVRTDVIPKKFREEILRNISSDTLMRRKEMRGDPDNFREWIVLGFRSDEAREFSFDLSALFAMIAAKDPGEARLSNVQLNPDEGLPFAERLPAGLSNLLRSDSMVAVGYKTGVANTYGDFNDNIDDRKEIAEAGFAKDEKGEKQPRDDERGARRVFVNTAVPFIGRPVRYIQSGIKALDIGRTIVSRPLIFTAPSTYKVLQGKSGYLDSAYVNLPNVKYEILVRFHPRMFGLDTGYDPNDNIKPIAEALRAINAATTIKEREEAFSKLRQRKDWFERFVSEKAKTEYATLRLTFPAVTHVVYNEFSMLGDEESLFENHASAKTFVQQGEDGPLNPLFRVDTRRSVDDRSTPRANIARGIPDKDLIPLSADGNTVKQYSRYGSMALRESVLRLVQDVNQMEGSENNRAQLLDPGIKDITSEMDLAKVFTHWSADEPGDPSFRVSYGAEETGIEMNNLIMRIDLDLTDMANLVRTNPRKVDAARNALNAVGDIMSALCALEHPGDNERYANLSIPVGKEVKMTISEGVAFLSEHLVNTHALIELFSQSPLQLKGIEMGLGERSSVGRIKLSNADRRATEDARERVIAQIQSNDLDELEFSPNASSMEGEVTHRSVFVQARQIAAKEERWIDIYKPVIKFAYEVHAAMETKTLPKAEPKGEEPVYQVVDPFSPPEEGEEGVEGEGGVEETEEEETGEEGTGEEGTEEEGTGEEGTEEEETEEEETEISFDWGAEEDEPAPTPPPLSRLGAYADVDMFMYAGRFIMRGIVTTVVRIKGRKGVPAIQYGGPFIRDIAEMNRRLRFTTGGIGRGTYPGGMFIGFYNFDEFRENPELPTPVSTFGVDGGFVERIMDVGGRFHRVNDSLAMVGATFNPSDGRVIHSTAKTTSIGRKRYIGMNEIPQAGIIVVYGNARGDGIVTATMDYSFIPTTNGRRGEVEERILSLQRRDGRGKLRQVALVHIRAQLRASSPTCRVHSILFGLNKNRAVANNLGGESFREIIQALEERGYPRLGFTSKVTPTIRTTGTTTFTGGPGEGSAGPSPAGPEAILMPIAIPVNKFPSSEALRRLFDSADVLTYSIDDLLTILVPGDFGYNEIQEQRNSVRSGYQMIESFGKIRAFLNSVERFEDTYAKTQENPYPIRKPKAFKGERKDAYEKSLALWVGELSDFISNTQAEWGRVEEFYDKAVGTLQDQNPALNTVPGLSFNDIVLSPYRPGGSFSTIDEFLLFNLLKDSVGTDGTKLDEYGEGATTLEGLNLDAERLQKPVESEYPDYTETLYYYVSHDGRPPYIYDPNNLGGPLRLERDPANFNTFVRIGNGSIFKTVPKVGQTYVRNLLLRSADEGNPMLASMAAETIIQGTKTIEPVEEPDVPRENIIVQLFGKNVYVNSQTREILLPYEGDGETEEIRTRILYEGYTQSYFATSEEAFDSARSISLRRGTESQAKITGTMEGNGALLEHAEDFHGMEEGEEVGGNGGNGENGENGGNGEGGETIEDIYEDHEDYEDYEEYSGEDEDWDNL